jgi:putative ABC transport system permease protein
MILLRLISLPDARKHILRTVLTISGIMLGVAVFVAMRLANQAIFATFSDTIDRIAGATQLQVSAGETGFDETILEKVQAAPEVRVAVPVIEAVMGTGLKGQGNLKVLAVDLTGDGGLRDYQVSGSQEDVVEDPLVFLAQPDSLIVSRDFAARNGLKVNDKIPMTTMDGEKAFTVRGIMRSGGLASAFGGNLAVMDIYAAQKVFGRGRRFDRIDLALRDGVDVKQGHQALLKLLPAGYSVEPPSARGRQFESLLRMYSLSMDICSMFALIVAMFVIYSSLLIAVTQRRKEIGILRALGATRLQIQVLFLGEGAVAGLVGSLLGLVLGIAISNRIGAYMNSMMEGFYGVMEQPHTTVSPQLVLLALGIGLLASVISAVVPAHNAAGVDAAVALQRRGMEAMSQTESRARNIVAGVLALISASCLIWSNSVRIFYTGYLLIAVVALLLTPVLTLWLARILRIGIAWLRPIEGALAADSIIQSPRRTSSTVAALMFSVAMFIGLAGTAQSTYSSVQDWLATTVTAPLFVSASEVLSARSFHFPAAILPQIREIAGIEEAQPVRNVRMTVRGAPVVLMATELVPFAKRTRGRRVVAGDYDRMHEIASQEKGIIVSENFTELQHLAMGSPVELSTPHGHLTLPIVGIIKDFSSQEGSIYMERSLYIRHWDDDSADLVRIYLKPGVSRDEVKRRILSRFEHDRRLFVLSSEDVKQYIMKIVDQWFGMTYIQIAIAVLVSILGIVNSLAVSISERKREFGVLRAIGGLGMQVRGSIWIEAVSIGVIGLILGFALGAVNLYYTLEMVRRQLAGMPLDYAFPLQLGLLLIPIILLAAVVAGFGPAEYAVRTNLVEALEYE